MATLKLVDDQLVYFGTFWMLLFLALFIIGVTAGWNPGWWITFLVLFILIFIWTAYKAYSNWSTRKRIRQIRATIPPSTFSSVYDEPAFHEEEYGKRPPDFYDVY